VSEKSVFIPEVNTKKCNNGQSTSYVKSHNVDKSPGTLSGWSPSPQKAAAKGNL